MRAYMMDAVTATSPVQGLSGQVCTPSMMDRDTFTIHHIERMA